MKEPIREDEAPDELESQFFTDDQGKIEIEPGVLVRIAETAASQVDGVTLDARFDIRSLIGARAKEGAKGVIVKSAREKNGIHVQVFVRMAYGQDMYQLADKLRKHVKAELEMMTRLMVRGIDVFIVGLIVTESDRERRTTDEGAVPPPGVAID